MHLKSNKSDGTLLMSNHFIYASTSLIHPLSNYDLLWLCPQVCQRLYIAAHLKPGKDPSDSDSCQPIALTHTLSKIFEWTILIDYRLAFSTSSLQFGFKQGLSTQLCTGLIKNVIACYNINDSIVFMAVLLMLVMLLTESIIPFF